MNEKKLLQKFLKNQCNAEEAERVDELLSNNPELLETIIPESEWQNHLKYFNDSDTNKSIYLKTVLLVVFIVLSFCVEYNYRNITNYTLTPRILSTNIYSNTSDSIKQIILSDSSIVALHQNSTFVENFTSRDIVRHINLIEGTLFVKVKKDKSRPFVAQSGTLQSTALGTEFTLTYNKSTANSSVDLKEGKLHVVDLKNSFNKSILYSGEKASITNNQWLTVHLNRINHKKNIVYSNHKDSYKRPQNIQVIEKNLIFDNTRLADILNFINNELDYPLAYNNKDIEKYAVSGKFPFKIDINSRIEEKEQTAIEIIELITKVNPLKIIKKHNTYILLTINNN